MAQPAAVLSILVKANTGQATTGLLRLNQQLEITEGKGKKVAHAMEAVAKAGALIGGAAVVGGIAYATKKAADFEQQMSNLSAVTDANARQMERFRKQALKAGADTKFSASQAAQAQIELAKGGLTVKQIMGGGLRAALGLAAAGEMELADAATATVNAMKLFGLRGKDAKKVADGFATAANSTTADVADFAMALSQGGSAAKAAGLNFSETVVALEALAEIGIKNSDAGTSLKTALIQLASPTEKATNLMEDLGLKFFNAHGEMKPLADISAMLRDKMGKLSREQRLANLTTLVGTDGMRALLALYDAGPKKLDRFHRELGKQGTAAEVAKKKQDNLKGSLEQLQGSFETLAIQVGSKMLPSLKTASDELTDFVNDIGKIVARDDLDLGEKLSRSFELAKVRAQPWINKLEDAIDKADVPEKLAAAISAATPVLAKAFAHAALVGAQTFVKTFLASDVWGRLAIGVWLLSKMGGPPAFMKLGGQAGTAFGTGMATGVASGGLKGKLVGLFKAWGPTLGIAVAATFGPELVKKLKDSTDQKLQGKVKFEGITKSARSFDELTASIDKTGDELEKGRITKAIRGPAEKWRRSVREVGDSFDKLAGPIKLIEAQMDRMASGSSDSIRNLRTNVRLNTRAIKRALGDDTAAGRDALRKNFNSAVENIRRSMREGKITTKQGTAEIERLMVKALQTMGFSEKQALTLRQGRDPYTGKSITGPQNLTGKQRGGPISGGAPSGDSIPALLERGEYVVNRNAVRKPGVRRALDRLNFGMASRFQSGGIVELLHPFNDPKGHGDHLHVAMSTVQAIIALGRRLQSMGWLVSENPAFGGVNGGHVAGSYHDSGLAIDVNWPNAAQERAKIAALLPMLQAGTLAANVPDLNRLTVNGPASMLKALTQAALDTTLGAAQATLNRAGMLGGVEGAESAGGQFGKRALMNLWTRAGGSPQVANLMAAIALAESGGRPDARNPSGASGLWQILGLPFPGDPFDPFTNARMAVSKYQSQGLGAWEVYTSGAYRQFLQKGGLVGQVGKTLRRLRKSPKLRKGAVDKLLDRIHGVGLSEGMEHRLRRYSKDATVFAEYADRAGALTGEDANGNPITAKVGGLTQTEWLQKELESLFKWRNTLIRAEEIVRERREQVAKAIERARTRLETVNKRLRTLNKHPKRNKAAIKALTRERASLADRILPALTDKRSGLSTLRGDLLSNLEDVQGLGAPGGVLKRLPAVGVLGGRIFDVQMQLRDLAAPPEPVTDTGTGTSDERAGLLEQLLREANLRTAVSERQFQVFKNMPQFATGGIVPGPTGAAVPALVHAGEGVFTQEQMAAMGAPQVTINVASGMEWLRQFITVEVGRATRTDARRANRGLPGRGGGLLRG